MTLERMSDEEILHIANPIMDNLMDASTAIEAIELASTPASGNLILDRCFTEMFKSWIRASSITGSKAPARECSYSCAICRR